MALPDGLGPTSPAILLIVDHLKKYSTEKERGIALLTGVRYAYIFKLLQIILFIIFPLPKKKINSHNCHWNCSYRWYNSTPLLPPEMKKKVISFLEPIHVKIPFYTNPVISIGLTIISIGHVAISVGS